MKLTKVEAKRMIQNLYLDYFEGNTEFLTLVLNKGYSGLDNMDNEELKDEIYCLVGSTDVEIEG